MKNILLILLFTTSLFSKSTTERAGDILALLLPATAFSTSLYLGDKEGQIACIKSYSFTMASTLALKYSIDAKRPDTEERDSFPSGHTSSAFAGASFIHKRYGWKYALPAYLGAIYTGYSRIDANRHHGQDVFAGAFLAIASSWYFTTPLKGVELFPSFGENKNGINLRYHW
jgi:membrane-associated phospholipid phosphatase